MPPSNNFDKFLKSKKKSRSRGYDIHTDDGPASAPSPSLANNRDSTAAPTPSKHRLRRILGTAANRTFHQVGHAASRTFHAVTPRSRSSTHSSDNLHVGNQQQHQTLGSYRKASLDLNDTNDDGSEKVALIDQTTLSLCVDIGGYSAAGWQLTVDATSGGYPILTRKSNQDSYGIIAPLTSTYPNTLLVGVYDGHGAHGRPASQLVRNLVPTILTESLKTMNQRTLLQSSSDTLSSQDKHEYRKMIYRIFQKAFCEAEKALKEKSNGIDHAYSGTTATCIWLQDNELYCAWSGDSRCILGRKEGAVVKAVDLSWDQKPKRDDEKKRVRAAGGRVTRWKKNNGPQRVWLPDQWIPGLAMTRSIGDTILSKYGVVANPEVTVTELSNQEKFVIVASDGVWEFMSSQEVVDAVTKWKKEGLTADEASKKLVKESVKRWSMNEPVVDDTSVVIVYLDNGQHGKSWFNGREQGMEIENRSIRQRLRGKKTEINDYEKIGKPWLVASNGRLESFKARNMEEGIDDDE